MCTFGKKGFRRFLNLKYRIIFYISFLVNAPGLPVYTLVPLNVCHILQKGLKKGDLRIFFFSLSMDFC